MRFDVRADDAAISLAQLLTRRIIVVLVPRPQSVFEVQRFFAEHKPILRGPTGSGCDDVTWFFA